MLMPKRVKYRKAFRGRRRGKALRGAEIKLRRLWFAGAGTSLDHCQADRGCTANDRAYHEAAWQGLDSNFSDHPVTKRAAESRMGKGKGAVEYYAAVVKPGRMMFEISGLDAETSLHALKQAAYKMPIRTRVLSRDDLVGGQI